MVAGSNKINRQPWSERYKLLKKFVEREGHALVKCNHVEEGFNLGRWVTKQRYEYKRGEAEERRIQMLEQVEGWKWKLRNRQGKTRNWSQAFKLVWQFAMREGHSKVPDTHVEDGYKLGYWVYKQRKLYKEGKLGGMQTVKLSNVPGWGWSAHSAELKIMVPALRKFIRREGHSRLPYYRHEDTLPVGGRSRPVDRSVPVGRWVKGVRRRYREGKLHREIFEALEEVRGWEWKPGRAKRP